MITFKCKMCGGDLSFEPGSSVAECPYCGTTQTLPKLDDDRRANLYDRANHFRRQNEYDKAMAIYEQILQEDRADAEAYWSLVLCRYGIEYVEDPATRKRVPTVNRVQYASILADEDYKSALNYADATQRGIYEAEANAIAEIQRGILDISKQEEPFDVFICYKETDANGRRTPDSVLATDLYHQLTKEGFKVFFARITLEDKIGTAYEPYIFAALNSARVMVVLGTKPEYFNAVWVKNEWSRYLALIRAGADKVLVPAYRDMDPYDLPEEFAHLQAQDMGKLGFMQDLIRGIKKLTAKDEPAPQPATPQVVTAAGANIENLMKRARLFMEDGDWKSAAEYLDKVLDEDAEYAPAYAGKVQAALKLRREEELAKSLSTYEDSADWKKAVRFAAPAQRNVYEGYVASAVEAREENRKQKIYDGALQTLRNATTIDDCIKAKAQFESIPGFRDSDQKAQACLEKIEQFKYQDVDRKAGQLVKAKPSEETAMQWEALSRAFAGIHWQNSEQRVQGCLQMAESVRVEVYGMASRTLESASTPDNCRGAMQLFESLGSFRDAKEQVEACQQKKAQLEAEIEEERKRISAKREEEFNQIAAQVAKERKQKRIRTILILALLAAIVAGAILYVKVIKPNDIYNSAVNALNEGKYEEARGLFVSLGNYKDAANKAEDCLFAHLASCRNEIAAYTARITAGNTHTVGLKSDGTVVAAGSNVSGVCDTDDWTDIVAVAAGYSCSAGQKSDGTVVAVGSNGFGQCDTGTWTDIVAVATGSHYTVGLKSDGTVIAVGGNHDGQCDTDDWTDIVAVAAGYSHTVGLKSDGTVVTVGSNGSGQCDTSGWANIVAVTAGGGHTVGLKSDGTVVAVGSNGSGQCDTGKWTDIVAVAAGGGHTVGLKSDGTVVAVGKNDVGQCDISAWADIVAVAAGYSHTVGLKSDGTVVTVGSNSSGQCDTSNWKLWD